MTIVTTRVTTIEFLDPPRQGTDAEENFQILNRWTWQLSQEIIRRTNDLVTNQNQILDRIEPIIAAMELIPQIEDPATATTEDVARITNLIIAAFSPLPTPE